MGCKQTTIKSPSLVFSTSPTVPITTPIYVKSALKKSSRINGKKKTERLSLAKRKLTTISKSVNFDEKVQVKLRTPTPKQTRYENTSSKVGPKQVPDDDNDIDVDDQVSSISSQEDIHIDKINPPLQRSQPNGFWPKNNSVTILPTTNNIKEKLPQTSVATTTTTTNSPTELLNIPTGNRFRVRRKVQSSNSVDSNPLLPPPSVSSPVPIYRSSVQLSPVSVPRPLPNTNPILIEHPTSYPYDDLSSQTSYYGFTRRTPTSKKTSTEK